MGRMTHVAEAAGSRARTVPRGVAVAVVLLVAAHTVAADPPHRTLVLVSGRTYEGVIEERDDGNFYVADIELVVLRDSVSRIEQRQPAEIVAPWRAEIEAKSTSDEVLTFVKFAMFNRLERAHATWGLERWKTQRNQTDDPAWEVTLTTHFAICAQVRDARLTEYAELLEKALADFGVKLPSKRTPGLDFLVRIYRDRELYVRETKSPGSAGLYMPGQRELAIFDEVGRKADTIGTILHEALHQYMNEYYNGCSTQCWWYEEGLAEYHSTARVTAGQLSGSGGKIAAHIDRLRVLVRTQALDLKKYWKCDYAAFLADGIQGYSLAWALVHFFFNTKDPTYQKAWQRWVSTQPTVKPHHLGRLFDMTLGRLDLEQLRKDLTRYIESL